MLEQNFQGISEFNYGLNGPLDFENQNGVIPILKLHGSINWNDKGAVYKNFTELRKSGESPLIIPPTWNKSFGDLSSVWNNAITALKSARNIIIMGFSMPPTDVHFKYLAATGLGENIFLRNIIFVNPGLNDETADNTDSLKTNLYNIFRKDIGGTTIKFEKKTIREFFTNCDCLQRIERLKSYQLYGLRKY
ncbi:MAG TPA: hypothetical protein VGO50_21355 [Pyrinomonadaceae bacterium]|nr:hypothetical protein [Pyrinomonadaceae bacterium]